MANMSNTSTIAVPGDAEAWRLADKYLGGETEDSTGCYVYWADETGSAWRITDGDLVRLGQALAAGVPGAYLQWCATCGEELGL